MTFSWWYYHLLHTQRENPPEKNQLTFWPPNPQTHLNLLASFPSVPASRKGGSPPTWSIPSIWALGSHALLSSGTFTSSTLPWIINLLLYVRSFPSPYVVFQRFQPFFISVGLKNLFLNLSFLFCEHYIHILYLLSRESSFPYWFVGFICRFHI